MTHSRYIFWLFFFGLGASLTSCKDTCEEAVKKTISCAPGEGLKSSLRDEQELAVKVCRPHEDQVKQCLKVADCTEFNRCMKNAVVFREGAPTRQPPTSEPTEPPASEKSAPDMPVIPD